MTTAASDLHIVPRPPLRRLCWPWWSYAANIQSLPRATTRGPGRRQAGAGQTVGSVSQIAGGLGRCWLRWSMGGLGHWRLAADRGAAKTG